MTNQHPITLPHELVEDWHAQLRGDPCPVEFATAAITFIATQAARWGADQELEACIKLLADLGGDGEMIRRYRRPKTPSLKEQALAVLDDVSNRLDAVHENIIRRAIEALPDQP